MDLMLQAPSYADTAKITYVAKASHLDNFCIFSVCPMSMWYVSLNVWKNALKNEIKLDLKLTICKKKKSMG